MFTSALADIPALIASYGYGLILVMVMLESLGLPLPGAVLHGSGMRAQ